jgi:hypothetical protein
MRSLEEIRNANKKKSLLFTGMDHHCTPLSPEEYERGRKEYVDFMRDSDRIWKKYVDNDKI